MSWNPLATTGWPGRLSTIGVALLVSTIALREILLRPITVPLPPLELELPAALISQLLGCAETVDVSFEADLRPGRYQLGSPDGAALILRVQRPCSIDGRGSVRVHVDSTTGRFVLEPETTELRSSAPIAVERGGIALEMSAATTRTGLDDQRPEATLEHDVGAAFLGLALSPFRSPVTTEVLIEPGQLVDSLRLKHATVTLAAGRSIEHGPAAVTLGPNSVLEVRDFVLRDDALWEGAVRGHVSLARGTRLPVGTSSIEPATAHVTVAGRLSASNGTIAFTTAGQSCALTASGGRIQSRTKSAEYVELLEAKLDLSSAVLEFDGPAGPIVARVEGSASLSLGGGSVSAGTSTLSIGEGSTLEVRSFSAEAGGVANVVSGTGALQLVLREETRLDVDGLVGAISEARVSIPELAFCSSQPGTTSLELLREAEATVAGLELRAGLGTVATVASCGLTLMSGRFSRTTEGSSAGALTARLSLDTSSQAHAVVQSGSSTVTLTPRVPTLLLSWVQDGPATTLGIDMPDGLTLQDLSIESTSACLRSKDVRVSQRIHAQGWRQLVVDVPEVVAGPFSLEVSLPSGDRAALESSGGAKLAFARPIRLSAAEGVIEFPDYAVAGQLDSARFGRPGNEVVLEDSRVELRGGSLIQATMQDAKVKLWSEDKLVGTVSGMTLSLLYELAGGTLSADLRGTLSLPDLPIGVNVHLRELVMVLEDGTLRVKRFEANVSADWAPLRPALMQRANEEVARMMGSFHDGEFQLLSFKFLHNRPHTDELTFSRRAEDDVEFRVAGHIHCHERKKLHVSIIPPKSEWRPDGEKRMAEWWLSGHVKVALADARVSSLSLAPTGFLIVAGGQWHVALPFSLDVPLNERQVPMEVIPLVTPETAVKLPFLERVTIRSLRIMRVAGTLVELLIVGDER